MYNLLLMFDFFGLFLTLIILVIFHAKQKLKLNYVVYFKFVIYLTLASIIIQLMAMYYLMEKNYFSVFRILMSFAIFLSISSLILIYGLLKTYFDPVSNKNKTKVITKVGIIILSFVCIASMFDGVLFVNDSNSKFVITQTSHLLFLFVVVYFFLVLAVTFKRRKYLSRMDKYAVILYILEFASIIVFKINTGSMPALNFTTALFITVFFVDAFTGEPVTEEFVPVYKYDSYKKTVQAYLCDKNIKRYFYIFDLTEYDSYINEYSSLIAMEVRNKFCLDLLRIFPKNVYAMSNSRLVCISKSNLSNTIKSSFIDKRKTYKLDTNIFIVKPLIGMFHLKDDFNKASDIIYASKNSLLLKEHNLKEITHIDSSILEPLEKNLRVENILRQNIKDNCFDIFYKPVFVTRDNRITALTANTAVFDQDKKVNFDNLTKIALQSGLLEDTENSIISSIAKFDKDNNLSGVGISKIYVYLTNLSFNKAGRSQRLIDTFRKYSSSSLSKITILLTEFRGNINEVNFKENMKVLKENGILLILNEYGSGYSTLNFITEIEFSGIKISGKIVRNIESSKESFYMLKYLLNVATKTNRTIFLSAYDSRKIDVFLEEYFIDTKSGMLYGDYKKQSDILKYITNKNKELIKKY